MKIPLSMPSMIGTFYPPQITTPLQVGYESVTFYLLSYQDLGRIHAEDRAFTTPAGGDTVEWITQTMATSHSTIRRRLASRLVLLTLAWSSCQSHAYSLELESEIAVSIESDQAVATSRLGGRREIPLDAQETVVWSGANGINAIVVTSRRLLGFSSRTLSWSKADRDLYEKTLERRILPTFSLVRTDKRLYGFRAANGIWFKEALGVREKVYRLHSNDYGSVAVTNERLVGFGPLLGEFSSKPLGVHERITQVGNESGVIIITTNQRTLVFGSRMSGWDEFE
jgi:hypothetical protein